MSFPVKGNEFEAIMRKLHKNRLTVDTKNSKNGNITHLSTTRAQTASKRVAFQLDLKRPHEKRFEYNPRESPVFKIIREVIRIQQAITLMILTKHYLGI